MSNTTTGGRRGSAAFAAIFAVTIITTSACGTDTGSTGTDPVTAAPAAVRVPRTVHSHAATSADAAERRAAEQADAAENFTAPPAGKQVPD